MTRILIIDKTAGLLSSHERHQALGAIAGIELHVFGPKHWVENGREVLWAPPPDVLYQCHLGYIWFKDYYARHYYWAGLNRAIKKSQPDVIQLLEEPWSIVAWQTWLNSRLYAPNAKLLFYTWENIYRPWKYPSRLSWLYKKIDRLLHRDSTAAICATEGAKTVLLKKGYDKPIVVVPYGIPNFFFQNKPEQKPESNFMTIGYVGRFLHMKGVDVLIKALQSLPECKLVLLGSGEDQGKFEYLVEELNLQERVEWRPAVSEDQMPAVMQQFEVLVLPSRTVEGWQEQLGRVLIEAMALGIPVVGSSSGAIPEVIGNAGLVFQEDDVADLVKNLSMLQDDVALRNELSKKGCQRAREQFTWERFAEVYSEFVLNLDIRDGIG